MRTPSLVLAVIVALCIPATASAAGGIGVKAGTLGFGVEGTIGLVGGLNLRVGANNFTYDYETDADDIRYDAELALESYALLLDWHPFSGTFRVTAGALVNRNELNLTATPTGLVDIGGTTYPAAVAGTLNGTLDFKNSAPYVGLGWGNAAGSRSGLGVSFEIGALFQDAPQVTLTSTNPLVLQSDLAAESQNIEDDLKQFKVYPVVAFGLSYQF